MKKATTPCKYNASACRVYLSYGFWVRVLIIRFSLLLTLGACANFLLAVVLEQVMLTDLAGQLSQLGVTALLGSFFLFLLGGLGLLSKLIAVAFFDYFSANRRIERRVLFYLGKRDSLNQLFHFKKARLRYFNQQHRKRLLKEDDRKSVPS
ncbi:hypothetical protein MGMO_155c00020 [Methyloglobulus morosus KoM1]|uniref:Uncharacterized protein n=1 Tax=Methyloglobulus morosus KoM1 TaxID=1116472 RepID=V5BP19_9GAMM|nr:hypothetical protein MGMO_155c00020 [Methyloglobulus morosus KoM1]